MSETKFTPGPWKPVTDAQGICGLMHPSKSGIAVAWLSSTFQPFNGYVGEEEHELGRPERQANAHLIAAAPDLYAVLDKFVAAADEQPSITSTDQIYALYEAARAALAKARGEA